MLDDILSDFRLFITVLCTALLLFFIIGLFIGRLIQRTKDSFMIKKERADAVRKSRAVLGGQFGEQLAPYLPDFPCNPGDVRFIGKPVDYIAFPGSAEGKPIRDVVLIEVKSGSSHLSGREREIKAASSRIRGIEAA